LEFEPQSGDFVLQALHFMPKFADRVYLQIGKATSSHYICNVFCRINIFEFSYCNIRKRSDVF